MRWCDGCLLATSIALATVRASAQAMPGAAPPPVSPGVVPPESPPPAAPPPSADQSVSVSTVHEEEDDTIGIDIGVRFGYAVPFGNIGTIRGVTQQTPTGTVVTPAPFGNGRVVGDTAEPTHRMRETFDGQLPIQLEIGYRLTPHLVVGAYGAYGFGFLAGQSPFSCEDRPTPDTADDELAEIGCSASVLRFGIQARYHFEPNELVDPWVGLNVGYESVTIKSDSPNSTLTLQGLELVGFNAGLDIKLLGRLAAGPYIQFSAGRYNSLSDPNDMYGDRLGCPGPACAFEENNVSVDETHYWGTGGLRASYVF